MKTFLIVIGIIAVAYLIWNFIFGESYREKVHEHQVWKYVEDNMFRLACVLDAIKVCTTADELKELKPWIDEKTMDLATQIATESQIKAHSSDLYTVRVAKGIIQMVNEEYDKKLNSI